MELNELARQVKEGKAASAERARRRYAYARTQGFTGYEAGKLKTLSEAEIDRLARERDAKSKKQAPR